MKPKPKYVTREWQEYESQPELKIYDIRLKSGKEIFEVYPKEGKWKVFETGCYFLDSDVTHVRLSHYIYD
jgi:hypothetical protein